MKKTVAIVLVLILSFSAVISASALDPNEPSVQVDYVFWLYYTKNTDGGKLKDSSVQELDYTAEESWKMFYVVKFTSEDAGKQGYFNRFGDDNMYYEKSDVTNLVFPSGIAVFIGNQYNERDYENFYSLEEIYNMDSELFDIVLKTLGSEYAGVMGGVESVSELDINIATQAQKIIVDEITCDDKRVFDFNGDDILNVADATFLQKYLVK